MIVSQIRELAHKELIPVLGAAPASAMANERPGRWPEDMLPGAQSLVCFGLPLPQGVYRTLSYTLETVWRAQNFNYRRLDTLSMRIAALLEEAGARSVPVYGCLPMTVDDWGQVVGYLNQVLMGRATGIGVVGKNGLLLHSLYGARLMLGGAVTTADLPRERYPEIDDRGCPPDCRLCADARPVQAISAEERRIRIMSCLSHTSRTPQMCKLWLFILGRLRPESAGRYMNLLAAGEALSLVTTATPQTPGFQFMAVAGLITSAGILRSPFSGRTAAWPKATGHVGIAAFAAALANYIGWLSAPGVAEVPRPINGLFWCLWWIVITVGLFRLTRFSADQEIDPTQRTMVAPSISRFPHRWGWAGEEMVCFLGTLQSDWRPSLWRGELRSAPCCSPLQR